MGKKGHYDNAKGHNGIHSSKIIREIRNEIITEDNNEVDSELTEKLISVLIFEL